MGANSPSRDNAAVLTLSAASVSNTIRTTPTAVPLRLLVSAGHELSRLGLGALARTDAGLEVAGEVEDPLDLPAAYERLGPDVVLVDVDSAGQAAAVRALLAAHPTACVVVVSAYDGDEDIRRALDAGACGYLLKTLPARELVALVRAAGRRMPTLPATVARRLAEGAGERRLTPREGEVLSLIAEGRNNAEIAALLEISAGTVKVHAKAIFAKIGAADRTEAAALAVRRGFARLH